jgi:hypothetical protein
MLEVVMPSLQKLLLVIRADTLDRVDLAGGIASILDQGDRIEPVFGFGALVMHVDVRGFRAFVGIQPKGIPVDARDDRHGILL